MFTTKESLGTLALDKLAKVIEEKKQHSPSQRTLLALGGSGDYSLAPARMEYPTEFLEQWGKRCPDLRIRFSIPSDYVKALQAEVGAGETHLEEYLGDTAYCFNAFWFDLPQVKQQFRRLEHQLQAAEMLATVASLRADLSYPSQDLYYSWISMLVNMDRNALWGAGAGNVFRDPQSWDVEDRYHAVKQMTDHVIAHSLQALAGKGESLALFNPLNW